MSSSNDTAISSQVESIKASAFGICYLRTLLSMLPAEAGAMRYDENTPDFEGVALDFKPNDNTDAEESSNKSPFGQQTLLSAAKAAKDFQGWRQHSLTVFPPEKNWNGFDFNVCRAHFVDSILLEAVAEGPIQQIVFCGVGQDYRGMRHAKAIKDHGAKVFELDLEPMMKSRTEIKEEICEISEGLSESLPETHELAIDFDKQSVSEVLLACSAFDAKVPTLYIWEGVTYYLTPQTMRSFFKDIHGLMSQAPPGERKHHRLFFDHLIDLPRLKDNDDIPAKAMLDMFANSEPLLSFLDFDQVGPYLQELGFCIHEQVLPSEMYKPYQVAANEVYHLKESKYFGMVVAKTAED